LSGVLIPADNHASGASILVVEDSAAMRARIVWELGEVQGVGSIWEAADVPSALQLLNAHQPAVAILDLHLGKELAFPILDRIHQAQFETVSIIFSNAAAGPLRDACLHRGARAFLPKSGGFEDVLNTVSSILSHLPSARPEHNAGSQYDQTTQTDQ
jgi:two-component system, NarL family, response regulator EvgA